MYTGPKQMIYLILSYQKVFVKDCNSMIGGVEQMLTKDDKGGGV